MKNVLVIGSINMDYTVYVNEFPLKGETILGESRFIQPGGKGANQAAAVAKSGLVKCLFKAAIGNDNDGKVISKALKDCGVNLDAKISKKETGNATIMVDSSSENEIIIVGGANSDLLPKDIKKELIGKADYVILQNEIPSKTNEAVIKMAHKLGKTVVYNPAPFREVNNSLLKYVDYFMPNEIELKQYAKCNDFNKACEKLMRLGIKNLIVTRGSKGSLLIQKGRQTKIDCFKVKAVDTVAAGDTFVGYFTSGLASGMPIEKALTYASKASSITVTRKGSLVSIPYGKEVKI